MKKIIFLLILLFSIAFFGELAYNETVKFEFYHHANIHSRILHGLFLGAFFICNTQLNYLIFKKQSHKVMMISSLVIWLLLTATIILLCDYYYRVSGMSFWDISFEGSILFSLYMEILTVPFLYFGFRRFVEEKTDWGKMGFFDSAIMISVFGIITYCLSSVID